MATLVEITASMVERAAVAILAEEAQQRLTDCCGHASKKHARTVARAALEAALDRRSAD